MSEELKTERGSEVLVSHDVRDHGGSDESVLASTLNATRAKNANIERSQRLPGGSVGSTRRGPHNKRGPERQHRIQTRVAGVAGHGGPALPKFPDDPRLAYRQTAATQQEATPSGSYLPSGLFSGSKRCPHPLL